MTGNKTAPLKIIGDSYNVTSSSKRNVSIRASDGRGNGVEVYAAELGTDLCLHALQCFSNPTGGTFELPRSSFNVVLFVSVMLPIAIFLIVICCLWGSGLGNKTGSDSNRDDAGIVGGAGKIGGFGGFEGFEGFGGVRSVGSAGSAVGFAGFAGRDCGGGGGGGEDGGGGGGGGGQSG